MRITTFMARPDAVSAGAAAAGDEGKYPDEGAAVRETAEGATAGAVEGAAQAVARAPSGPRPHPDNWESLTKAQRESWRSRARRNSAGHEGT